MRNTGWLIWMVVMCSLLIAPIGYGWGYRGWGAPYPSYLQRRRHAAALASGSTTNFDHRAWGYGGDFIWAIVVIGAIWRSHFIGTRHISINPSAQLKLSRPRGRPARILAAAGVRTPLALPVERGGQLPGRLAEGGRLVLFFGGEHTSVSTTRATWRAYARRAR